MYSLQRGKKEPKEKTDLTRGIMLELTSLEEKAVQHLIKEYETGNNSEKS